MSTDYYNSLYLSKTPTGFGTYTGINVVNSGDFPIKYTVNISNTTFVIEPVEADAQNGSLYDTFFISDSDKNLDLGSKTLDFALNPNETGFFYLFHRPFYTFNAGHESTGIETSTLSIYSNSSLGDSDDLITINATGQRVLNFEEPSRVAKFYGIKNYDFDNGFNIKFNWSCLSGYSYITGFRLDLSSASDFSVYESYYLPIVENSVLFSPNYGTYSGFLNQDFYLQIGNLSFGQDYYSRITPINGNGDTGEFAYPTGFDTNAPDVFDDITYSGLHESPGANLKYIPGVLSLEYKADRIENFDLAEFLYSINDSYDFSFYSGISVKFSPEKNDFGLLISNNSDKGAINFIPDNALVFSTGYGGIFKLSLQFENMRVLGAGGDGVEFDPNGEPINAQNGGPIFNFDNLSYTDENGDFRKFEYHIKKDVDSLFYAGLGGGQGVSITDESNALNFVIVEGKKISVLDSSNLITSEDILSVAYEASESDEDKVIQLQGAAGNDGPILAISDDTKLYPDIFLGFHERESFLSNNIYFRFSSNDITSNVGDTTNAWISSENYLKSSFSLQNSTYDALATREAYGKKFYELLSDDSDNAIKKTVSLPVGINPSYTILVFALAKETLDSNYASSYYQALTQAANLHKFINSNGGSYYNASDLLPINFSPSAVNANNFYSIFCGTPLNSSPFYSIVDYAASYNGWLTRARVDYRAKWGELNPVNNYGVPEPIGVVNLTTPNDQYDMGVFQRTSIFLSQRSTFKNFNIRNLRNFESSGSPVDFTMSESSGSDINFQMFSLFFVQMHGTVVRETVLENISTAWNDIGTANSTKNFLINQTIINGLETSRVKMGLNIGSLPNSANYILQLNNSVTESSNKTRLFLFDYLYGEEQTPERRDEVSKNIIEYLAYNLSPILLKSSSDIKIAGMSSGGAKTSVDFPAPIAHPYLNLYSS